MVSNKTLSGRERIQLALAHKQTDRIPVALVCSGINPPAMREFKAYLKKRRHTDAKVYLESVIDLAEIGADYAGPKLPAGTDMWGVARKAASYGSGSCNEICHYPLAKTETVSDLEKHIWPTTDLFDYSALKGKAEVITRDKGLGLMAGDATIFETAWSMRGFEQIVMDFAMKPELVHAIMGKVTDFYIEHAKKTLSAADGLIDLYFTADDIAGQRGMPMSLEIWEKFIKPYHTRLNKAIHEFGAKVIFHSDGDATRSVPGLIDMGIDVLQAPQFDAGEMNPAGLKNTYGDRLCFEGGVSMQSTPPFGFVGKVVAEVKNRIKILGKNGGYILGPSRAIQAGTPPENIYAMFETARNYYPFN